MAQTRRRLLAKVDLIACTTTGKIFSPPPEHMIFVADFITQEPQK